MRTRLVLLIVLSCLVVAGFQINNAPATLPLVTSYNALTTAGQGIAPIVVAYNSGVVVNAALSNVGSYTPATSGTFRACYEIHITTVGSAGNVQGFLNRTADAVAISSNQGQAGATTTSTANVAGGCFNIYSDASTAINFSTVLNGVTGTPQYRVVYTLERLN